MNDESIISGKHTHLLMGLGGKFSPSIRMSGYSWLIDREYSWNTLLYPQEILKTNTQLMTVIIEIIMYMHVFKFTDPTFIHSKFFVCVNVCMCVYACCLIKMSNKNFNTITKSHPILFFFFFF